MPSLTVGLLIRARIFGVPAARVCVNVSVACGLPEALDVDEPKEFEPLLARLKGGDQAALGELFAHHRERLRRMVEMRLDVRLNGRISSSDVLQETYIAALQRVNHYFAKPDMPFEVWLRLIASQRLVEIHRHHLGAQMRSAANEISIDGNVMPQASSVTLAKCLAAQFESPSQVAIRRELLSHVEDALNSMDPLDREVLALRHFDEMSNDEVAALLGIKKAAASNRYVRALGRLKEALSHVQDSGAGPRP